MMHSHDYWGGETRKVLFQEDMWFIPLPVAPCRSGTFPGGDCYTPGTSIADIDIPEPFLVYEGTGSVEVLFDNFRAAPDCTSITGCVPAAPNPVVTMAFDYITAADDPGEWRIGSTGVTPGTPVVLPVQPLEADMPHQAKSFWVFRIYTDAATSIYFNFTVTAVKGNPIVNWPPHPDLYADSTERVIFDGPVTTETRGWAEYWLSGADANWVQPERVISYGTDKVVVEITKTGFTMNGAEAAKQPDYFNLEFHNASFISKMGNGELVGGRIRGESSDGTTFRFEIPVDEYGMDTPYGQKSRWAFRFMARFDDGGTCGQVDPSIEQGCQWFPYKLDYTMKITAYGHSISGEGITDQQEVTEVGANETNETPA
ncbi:MAG: hypothetical protein ACLGIK_14780 [Gemmatimonadota bacterium]